MGPGVLDFNSFLFSLVHFQTGEFSARFLLKLPVDFSDIPVYLLKVTHPHTCLHRSWAFVPSRRLQTQGRFGFHVTAHTSVSVPERWRWCLNEVHVVDVRACVRVCTKTLGGCELTNQ